ncbi:hypothetical protein HPB52_023859 [Rhipicephalus sanguineus]|uniref:Uncharacterized protein n=1 Tax=Rhipicephalus sanguineus TaxID=34632 RepID=A0A9D4SV39_RHISA|nr:hypothetical protein HPB52_023859 [Rhipicephalus sanguineus]
MSSSMKYRPISINIEESPELHERPTVRATFCDDERRGRKALMIDLQECFRLLFFRVLRKAERVLNAVALTAAEDVLRSRLAFAYTAGLAFGAMSALFSLLGQLADALGPGTAGIFGGTPRRLTVAAITAATFSVLHVFWALVSFHALDTRRWSVLAFAPAAHMAASAATLLAPGGDYVIFLGALCAVLAVSAAMAFHAAGGSAGNIVVLFRRGSKK